MIPGPTDHGEVILAILRDVVVLRQLRRQRAAVAGEAPDTLDQLEAEILYARLDLAREQERRARPPLSV